MKTKLSLLLVMTLLASASVFSQTTFGIRGGVNFANLNGHDADDKKINNKIKTGFNVGVNAEIPIGDEFFLQPGVLFTTKGAKAETADASTRISYIEVPVNFIYKPAVGTGHVLLGFGPYAAIGVGGTNQIGNNEADLDFGNEVGMIKRFDAGANLLAGYEFSNRLSAQLNAGLGLLKVNNRPPGDNNTSLRNTTFGVSLGYRFAGK